MRGCCQLAVPHAIETTFAYKLSPCSCSPNQGLHALSSTTMVKHRRSFTPNSPAASASASTSAAPHQCFGPSPGSSTTANASHTCRHGRDASRARWRRPPVIPWPSSATAGRCPAIRRWRFNLARFCHFRHELCQPTKEMPQKHIKGIALQTNAADAHG